MLSCGTIEGYIETFDFKSNLLFLLKLKETPINIIITDSWGFTIVQTQNYLYTISPTGKIIKEKKITFGISYWCTWSTEKGIDYLAIVGNKSHLYVCEAFNLDLSELHFSFSSSIKHISYVNENHFFVILTNNGKIHIFPITF